MLIGRTVFYYARRSYNFLLIFTSRSQFYYAHRSYNSRLCSSVAPFFTMLIGGTLVGGLQKQNVLISDSDTAWLRDPRAFFQEGPNEAADVSELLLTFAN